MRNGTESGGLGHVVVCNCVVDNRVGCLMLRDQTHIQYVVRFDLVDGAELCVHVIFLYCMSANMDPANMDYKVSALHGVSMNWQIVPV